MATNISRVRLNSKLLFLLVLCPLLSFSQSEEESFEYSKEFTWGINKNTNSGLIGGFVMKFSRSVGEEIYRTIGFELVNVKHPKERRYISQTGTSFIFSKQNFLYALRGQYGYEKIMFKKAPQQGVQINVNAAAGPTIGIVAPYYVVGSGSGESEVFDPVVHLRPENIQGSGRLFQGLGQSKIVPALNLKTGVVFEFGTFRKNVAGVEVGLAAEVYTKKIILVPTQKNRSLFTSAFFTLFWGSRK